MASETVFEQLMSHAAEAATGKQLEGMPIASRVGRQLHCDPCEAASVIVIAIAR